MEASSTGMVHTRLSSSRRIISTADGDNTSSRTALSLRVYKAMAYLLFVRIRIRIRIGIRKGESLPLNYVSMSPYPRP